MVKNIRYRMFHSHKIQRAVRKYFAIKPQTQTPISPKKNHVASIKEGKIQEYRKAMRLNEPLEEIVI